MSKSETQTRKVEQDIRALRHDEVDAVAGAGMFSAISSAVSEVMKNFGSSLNTAARGG